MKTQELIFVITNIFRIYVIARFLDFFSNEEKEAERKRIWLMIGYAVISSGIYLLTVGFLENFVINILGIFAMTWGYFSCWKQRFWITCTVFLINMCCDAIVSIPLFLVFGKDTISPVSSVLVVLLLLICELFSERLVGNVQKKEAAIKIPLMVVPALSMGILILLVGRKGMLDDSLIITGIGLIFINFFVLWLYQILLKTMAKQYENEILKKALKAYKVQLELIQNSERQIRALRHDMKHHLNELHILAKENQASELEKYLGQMQEYIGESKQSVQTGNVEMDSIMNYMLGRAREKGIQVVPDICIPEGMLHSFDINIVLGNLLENAIEAASACTEPMIRIEAKYKQGVLIMNVENTYVGKAKENGKIRELETTKEDKVNHGYGLQNIRQVVEKYNGYMEIKRKDNVFTVKIMMYL